jgi:hypothetical protein
VSLKNDENEMRCGRFEEGGKNWRKIILTRRLHIGIEFDQRGEEPFHSHRVIDHLTEEGLGLGMHIRANVEEELHNLMSKKSIKIMHFSQPPLRPKTDSWCAPNWRSSSAQDGDSRPCYGAAALHVDQSFEFIQNADGLSQKKRPEDELQKVDAIFQEGLRKWVKSIEVGHEIICLESTGMLSDLKRLWHLKFTHIGGITSRRTSRSSLFTKPTHFASKTSS